MGKLLFQKILELNKKDKQKLNRIINRETKEFVFGVTNFHKNLFSILFDVKIPIEFLENPLPPDAPQPIVSVIKDDKLAGKVVEKEINGLKKIKFYIKKEEFKKLKHDAKKIYEEYSRIDTKSKHKRKIIFYRIPDVWFKNTKLIQFLKELFLNNITFKKEYKSRKRSFHVPFWWI